MGTKLSSLGRAERSIIYHLSYNILYYDNTQARRSTRLPQPARGGACIQATGTKPRRAPCALAAPATTRTMASGAGAPWCGSSVRLAPAFCD